MVDHAARLPPVTVCNEARQAIYEGLKQLASHIKKPNGEMVTIVDAIIADVAHARTRAAEFHRLGVETENEKLLMVAAKYDEMIINADVRMLELGVKAANNEQQSYERQLHIDAYKAARGGEKPAITAPTNEIELAKLQQRAQLLQAAQATVVTKDAEFTEAKPFSDDS